MAWGDILSSIFKAARILRLDITEPDLPAYDDYKGLVALDKKLWYEVNKQKKEVNHGRI